MVWYYVRLNLVPVRFANLPLCSRWTPKKIVH